MWSSILYYKVTLQGVIKLRSWLGEITLDDSRIIWGSIQGFCSAKDLPRCESEPEKETWNVVGVMEFRETWLVILLWLWGWEGGTAKVPEAYGSWEFKEVHLASAPQEGAQPCGHLCSLAEDISVRCPWMTEITNAYSVLRHWVQGNLLQHQEETKILLRKVFPSILFHLYTTTTVPDKHAHRYTKLLGIFKRHWLCRPALNIEPRTRDIPRPL